MENQIVQKPQALTLSSLVSREETKKKFADILGRNSASYLSALVSIASSPILRGCDPTSILACGAGAACLGLACAPNLGYVNILPFKDKVKGMVAQLQIGYKGFIQLAQRSGQYLTINATDVREGEIKSFDLLSGSMKFEALTENRTKAKIVGYAAHFELMNGFRKTLYMTTEELKEHANKYSKSYQNDKYGTSLWNTNFDAMAKKTVLKLLISKFGPMTIEMQNAVQLDQSVIKNPDNINGEYIPETDFEYVDNMPDAEPIETASQEEANKLNAERVAAAKAASNKG